MIEYFVVRIICVALVSLVASGTMASTNGLYASRDRPLGNLLFIIVVLLASAAVALLALLSPDPAGIYP